jgi:hypothetical protein
MRVTVRRPMAGCIRRDVPGIPHVTRMSPAADMTGVSYVTDVAHAAVVAEMHVRHVHVARQERHQRIKHANAQTGEVDDIYCVHITPQLFHIKSILRVHNL